MVDSTLNGILHRQTSLNLFFFLFRDQRELERERDNANQILHGFAELHGLPTAFSQLLAQLRAIGNDLPVLCAGRRDGVEQA